jgi:TfoX/Sxy family transcriptional regulator of competence genes
VAYDEGLATRLLDILGDEADLAERKMFGGLAVLLGGNMAAGVYGDDLLVRIDPGQQEKLLKEPGTRLLESEAEAAPADSSSHGARTAFRR